MNISRSEHVLAITDVAFAADRLLVTLNDQRVLALPLEWYPRLAEASDDQRADWRLLGAGEGINWPGLDEDLSLESFLNGWPAGQSPEYQRRRPVEYVALEEDVAESFHSQSQVNDALREYLRMKHESA